MNNERQLHHKVAPVVPSHTLTVSSLYKVQEKWKILEELLPQLKQFF